MDSNYLLDVVGRSVFFFYICSCVLIYFPLSLSTQSSPSPGVWATRIPNSNSICPCCCCCPFWYEIWFHETTTNSRISSKTILDCGMMKYGTTTSKEAALAHSAHASAYSHAHTLLLAHAHTLASALLLSNNKPLFGTATI